MSELGSIALGIATLGGFCAGLLSPSWRVFAAICVAYWMGLFVGYTV